MFERFTHHARRVLPLAQEEARSLHHDFVGPQHLLLGLIQGEGTAAEALRMHDVSSEIARAAIERDIGRGHNPRPAGSLPLANRAKDVLANSHYEAQQLGHSYIGPEHILLSLARGERDVTDSLTRLGADPGLLRSTLLNLLQDRPRQGANAEGSAEPRTVAERGSQLLAEFARVLDENTRYQTELERLNSLLRQHGIEPVPGNQSAIVSNRLAEVGNAKTAALEHREFERAASLRDEEKQLMAEHSGIEHPEGTDESRLLTDLQSVLAENRRLHATVEQVCIQLLSHGIDPGEPKV